MSVIIDLNLVCLVCLQESDELRCVFENDDQQLQTIAEKIASCSVLCPKIENSKLPDNICGRCLGDLDSAWRFRQNCEKANSLFLSITQQEQEAEALANYELEQQKIKLPSGLKIKRIQPETKTYLLPVLKDDETSAQEQQENEEDVGSPESETETEKLEEVTEEEHVDFDEYYETDYMLDSDEEVVHVLKEDNGTEDNTIKMDEIGHLLHNVETQHIEIKIEEDDEDEDEDEFVIEKLQEKQPEKVRVGLRGRPGKNVQVTVTKQSPIKEEEEEESYQYRKIAKKSAKIKKDSEHFKKPQPTSDRSTLHSENGFLPVATRKRKSHSPDSRPAKICEICGNSYKYQHALNAHMRRHTNTRPFSCEFCDKAFVSGVELRRHMRVHTGHKPYPCQHCDRRFSDFGSRIKHERTHTGERPYVCGTCGKSFAYAHVLSVHVRTHTGEKRFQCQRCGKGFTKKAYLQSHMKLHSEGVLYHEDADDDMLHDLSGGDMTPIKTVALEYVVGTDYVVAHKDELVDLASDDEAVEENMAEEHLEEVEHNEFILGVR